MKSKIQILKPYLVMSIIWGVIGGGILLVAESRPSAIEWRIYSIFWVLSSLNLLAMGALLQSLLGLASNQKLTNQPFLVMQSGAWSAIKLVCLGILVFAISRAKVHPPLAWILGLANLLVTPLGGTLLGRFFKTEYV